MSLVTRAVFAGLLTFAIGGGANLLLIRLKYAPRFYWMAAVVSSLFVGISLYWYWATGS